MSQISFIEKPEVLRNTMNLFLGDLKKYDQFQGIFSRGNIDGTFHSTASFSLIKKYSFVLVKGSYNLDQGLLSFRLSPTFYYYIISSTWLIFSISGATQLFHSPFPILLFAPVFMGFSVILIYYFIFLRREKEFVRIFQYYLKQIKKEGTV